jgi:uncharacterized protein (UPF0303 family)
MAENIPVSPLTPEAARAAQEVLFEQERKLRYPKSFGAYEALELGQAAISLVPEYESGYTVTITREHDGVRMFQWVADDKEERNLLFAEGKRAAARKAGHASPWLQLEGVIAGDAGSVWGNVPAEVPACGAFPIRVGDEWVATIAVSGYMEGLDHEVILRALERVLGVEVPRWDAPVA